MNNETKTLKLLEIREEIDDIKTFSFETGGIEWIPGQYQTYVLPTAGEDKKDNLRYFTIASAPNEQKIDITTRITDSIFKKTLNSLEIGDSIEASNLQGDFIWNEETSKPIVMIAAGIGVTPFRSMLLERKAHNQSLDATLIYFNRTEKIPFLSEFKQLELNHPEFKLITLIGEHVTAERILELAPENSKEGTMFISGPEPMVENIGEELKKQNITVKQDWFPGYTQDNF